MTSANRNTVLAPIFMMISALSFAMMSAAVKYAETIPFMQKVFFRNFIMLLIIIPVLVIKKHKGGSLSLFTGRPGSRPRLLLRSLFGCAGVVLYFYSVTKLQLGDSAILNKLSVFFVMILSAVFLGEKLRRFHIPALIAAFLGALIVIKPGFNMQFLPAAMAVTGALSGSVAYTIIASLKGKEDSMTIIFWFSSVSIIVTAFPMLAVWSTPSLPELAALVLTGIFAAGGQYFVTLAYTHGPAGEVSIYNYTQVVFSVIIGFFLWGDFPDLLSLAGSALIIGAAVFLYLKSRCDTVRELPGE